MTVVGLGIDLVGLDRFGDQLDDRASALVASTFTAAEQHAAHVGATPTAEALAAVFAAKEAFLKAWSSARFGRAPALDQVSLTDIEVVADSFGRPALRLHGPVADAVDQLAGELGPLSTMVSITHDRPVAAAVVVLQTTDPSTSS